MNDAPALAKAQIGIAVHGATDAAKSAGDIVLTKDGLSPIYTAIQCLGGLGLVSLGGLNDSKGLFFGGSGVRDWGG